MSQGKKPGDEKLIRQLYERLDWFTFEASEEEFDLEQVRAIMRLLESLDPLGQSSPLPDGPADLREDVRQQEDGTVDLYDSTAAYDRFKDKFAITEEALGRKEEVDTIIDFFRGSGSSTEFSEELAAGEGVAGERAKNGGGVVSENEAVRRRRRGSGKFRNGVLVKVASAVAIFAAVFGGVNIATNAVAQKSFFEIVRDGVNGMQITVTGNEMEVESSEWASSEGEPVYYDSWEDMEAAVGVDLLEPTYLPDGVELEEMYVKKLADYVLCSVFYGKELIYKIRVFSDGYKQHSVYDSENWIIYDDSGENKFGAEIYSLDGQYRAFWTNSNQLYSLCYTDYDELLEIVNQLE